MDYLKQLNWRYATKRMNKKTVPQNKIDNILEAIRLSPSSLGLQPYTVVVIEDEAVRAKMLPAIYNQPQIVEGSHVLVFAVWDGITPEQVQTFIKQISKEREVSEETLEDFKNMILGFISQKEKDELVNWNARQAYIALGTGMVAAALEEVDATPMEGFDPQALDQLLKLNEKGLKSVAILALGYRDSEEDKLAQLKKVRRSKEEFFLKIDSVN